MRVTVRDVGCAFGRQTSAYAEYRIFSSLARFGDVVREADVSLTSRRSQGAARCVVTLSMDEGRRLQISARARHVYDAIDRAAARLGRALRRPAAIAVAP
jgi:ribosome-associated translation inhibitor RaiA